MRTIYTIGYEGLEQAEFIRALRDSAVDVLLDVREMPLSRKRGFSKTPLSLALPPRGVRYLHERRLGAPTEVRNRLRVDGDWARYCRDFDKHLAKQAGLVAALAAELKGNIALMCFERDPAQCHRSAVARALAEASGCPIKHLVPEAEGRSLAWFWWPDEALEPA